MVFSTKNMFCYFMTKLIKKLGFQKTFLSLSNIFYAVNRSQKLITSIEYDFIHTDYYDFKLPSHRYVNETILFITHASQLHPRFN
jgi:hypothetical protein